MSGILKKYIFFVPCSQKEHKRRLFKVKFLFLLCASGKADSISQSAEVQVQELLTGPAAASRNGKNRSTLIKLILYCRNETLANHDKEITLAQ